MIVCVAMSMSFISCKHATATVYFENHYAYICAVQVFEGEVKNASEKAPILTGWATSGKTVVEPSFKFPDTCSIIFFIGTQETTEGDKTMTTMEACYPMVETDLQGKAVVTLKIDAEGHYGITSSNM